MEIPSTNPSFVGIIVAIHITLGLAVVIAGAVAMLRRKGHGRHSFAGNLYYWCLAALFALATLLSVMRWAEDHDLFIFGALALITVPRYKRRITHTLPSARGRPLEHEPRPPGPVRVRWGTWRRFDPSSSPSANTFSPPLSP